MDRMLDTFGVPLNVGDKCFIVRGGNGFAVTIDKAIIEKTNKHATVRVIRNNEKAIVAPHRIIKDSS